MMSQESFQKHQVCIGYCTLAAAILLPIGSAFGSVYWLYAYGIEEAASQIQLNNAETEKANAEGDIAEKQRDQMATPAVGLSAKITPTCIGPGLYQMDLTLTAKNDGFCPVRLAGFDAVYQRGVPKEEVLAALERSRTFGGPEVPQAPDPTRGLYIPEPAVAAFHKLQADTNLFRTAPQTPEHAADRVNRMITMVGDSVDLFTKYERQELLKPVLPPEPPPQPAFGIYDLSGKHIDWAGPGEAESKRLDVVLHEGQTVQRTFRFLLETNSPECYRFTAQVTPAADEAWGLVQAELTLPLTIDGHASLCCCNAQGGVVSFDNSTEIEPNHQLFKRPATE